MSDGSIRFNVRRPMRPLGIAASGLTAQRARIDAISANIANAETTRSADGTPYRRKVVNLQEVAFEPLLMRDPERLMEQDPEDLYGGVRVTGVSEDQSEGQLVYDPGHPDADEKGYVMMPNVDINTEIVDLMGARRLFEANATVFEAVKSILRRSTQL